MRRGALELSTNALVVFIISVIILGFGVTLVSQFFKIGVQVVNAPDTCKAQLDQAIAQGDRFAICPSVIPATEFSPHKAYRIEYEYFNLASSSDNYSVGIVEPSGSSFEAQPSPLNGVAKGTSRVGRLLIRPASTSVTGPHTLKVFICPLDTSHPDDATAGCTGPPFGSSADPTISRVLTIHAS